MMKIRIRHITLLIVLALPTLLARTPDSSARAQTEGYVASLEPVLGLIQHQTALDDPRDLASWHTVTETILVGEGDRIRTDGDGLAYLTFFEGVETDIQASTLVVVSTLILPDETDESFDISLDVLVGTTFNSVEAVLDAGDRFEIHTPGATAVVRGTRWWTIVTPAGESAFATERGRVQIIPNVRVTPVVATATPPPAESTPEEGPTALPGEPAEAVGAAPPPAVSAAATGFLTEGAAILTDRNGDVIDYAEHLDLPERPERDSIQRSLVAPDCGDGVCRLRERITCRVDCLDQIELPGCGDGVCDLESGEDLLVCAADCGPWAGDSCGDGVCDTSESGLTCPADCAPDQYFSPIRPQECGNGTCDVTESALNCPADCARRP
jgi:hypothetical protein